LLNCLILFGSSQISCTAETLVSAVRGRRTRQIRREWKRLQHELELVVPQVQRLMLEAATPHTAVQ
jgi:hypothetical protein